MGWFTIGNPPARRATGVNADVPRGIGGAGDVIRRGQPVLPPAGCRRVELGRTNPSILARGAFVTIGSAWHSPVVDLPPRFVDGMEDTREDAAPDEDAPYA